MDPVPATPTDRASAEPQAQFRSPKSFATGSELKWQKWTRVGIAATPAATQAA